ncbi:MAG: matrixin family metalloprotease [Dehalococcoidia bacterium]|nr:matrixin family metalloprotease [Dehalococcoidia bacterium]
MLLLRLALPRPARLVLVSVTLLLALALLAAVAPSAAEADVPPSMSEGWTPYDGGSLLLPADYEHTNSMPLELMVDYFTTGTPRVRWETSVVPTVPLCTQQANRPAWISAEQFRAAVVYAVDQWSEAEARVGFNYTGDCLTASPTWRFENNLNEIGWDDARDVVRSPAAAITQGAWVIGLNARPFAEADIIFDHLLNVPEQCFLSTMTHELGHVLGLGHSSAFGDLMYPSFNSADVSTCPPGPSAGERQAVQALYGVNRKPVFDGQRPRTAVAGSRVTLSAVAMDPDGDALTYAWTQVGGPSVAMTPSGPTLTFVAPDREGVTLQFRVEATDRYLHRADASITVRVQEASSPPRSAPSLGALTAGAKHMLMEWSTSEAATEYEFCSAATGGGRPSCVRQDSPLAAVTWDTVLRDAVEGGPRRIFTTGTRETSMRACNDEGCSPVGVGPHAGGLRWTAYDVDYDYFAMAYDVPGSSMRFTIVGVANIDGPARRVSLYSGPEDDPTARRILNCGNVRAGQVCIGLLSPSDRGHAAFATVVSERSGTPTLEHRIRIR